MMAVALMRCVYVSFQFFSEKCWESPIDLDGQGRPWVSERLKFGDRTYKKVCT